MPCCDGLRYIQCSSAVADDVVQVGSTLNIRVKLSAGMMTARSHLYSISGMSAILGCSSHPSPQLLDAINSAASCTAPMCVSVTIMTSLYVSFFDTASASPVGDR